MFILDYDLKQSQRDFFEIENKTNVIGNIAHEQKKSISEEQKEAFNIKVDKLSEFVNEVAEQIRMLESYLKQQSNKTNDQVDKLSQAVGKLIQTESMKADQVKILEKNSEQNLKLEKDISNALIHCQQLLIYKTSSLEFQNNYIMERITSLLEYKKEHAN